MAENARVSEDMVLAMREHVILRLMGRQPIWMTPKVLPPELDPALSWPDLFVGLPEEGRRAVREACAGCALACNEAGDPRPSRAEVAELAAEARDWLAGDETWPTRVNRRPPR